MIQKLQRQFILIASGAIAVLLFALLGLLNLYNYNDTKAGIFTTLHYLSDMGGEIPEDFNEEDIKNEEADLTMESPFQLRYFSVRLSESGAALSVNLEHIASVDRSTAIEYAKRVVERKRPEGLMIRNRQHYAFQCVRNESNIFVVFLDCTAEIRNSQTLARHSMFFGVMTLALFTAVIFVLSKQAIEPIARSMESQEQFITNAGHELKTPLAIIAADTEFLEMLAGESEWTQSIRNQVNRMTSLVNRLIRLAKLAERKEVELSRVDFSACAREISQSFLPLAEQQRKTLEITVQDEIFIMATHEGLEELVSILVDNAVKYCDEEGTVRVSLAKRPRSRGIMLRVSNDYAEGTGMDMSRFFDRFYRQDQSHNSKVKGYGIGLSMAQGLAREFKGRIAVEYRNGVIAFVVLLPIAA